MISHSVFIIQLKQNRVVNIAIAITPETTPKGIFSDLVGLNSAVWIH